MSKIAITGGAGFVGSALVHALLEGGRDVVVLLRQEAVIPGADISVVGDLEQASSQSIIELLRGREVLVHLAARVHVMRETSEVSARREYFRVNVDATRQLASHAVQAGVKRFVFISSIKVNGELSEPGHPFTADDRPMPVDPYGESKREAEDALRQLSAETGLEVTIIRPPLVYGPGVKANFLRMMRGVYRGVPWPLGAVSNRRSLVALDNLVDLIITCIDHPAAANQTFLVSDGEDLSTPELLQRVGVALGRPARLVAVPPSLLQAGASMLGKRAVAQRLLASLQVDISKTRALLGWTPPLAVDDALRKTAARFLADEAPFYR